MTVLFSLVLLSKVGYRALVSGGGRFVGVKRKQTSAARDEAMILTTYFDLLTSFHLSTLLKYAGRAVTHLNAQCKAVRARITGAKCPANSAVSTL